MGWQKMDEYYFKNGTSTITKINIGDKVIYELWYQQKQYSQFNSSKEAIAKFKELESQA